LLYLVGRVYCDVEYFETDDPDRPEIRKKWIYEKWNKCIVEQQYPDLLSFLANTHARARNEVAEFEKRINRAKEELIRIAEEKKQAQLAAMQKQKDQKNAKGGKGKGKKEDDVPLTAEVLKETPKPKTAEPERELDLTVPEDFAEMLRLKIPRPFTFGPILLDGLDKSFDMEAAYDLIIGTLEQRSIVGEENFLIHGLSI